MSEYKSPHESWCDTENNISIRCNCIVSGYLDRIEDLKQELDEVKAEYLKYMHEQYLEHSKSEQQLADYQNALEKIKNGGLPDGVSPNVIDRMLAMCSIAKETLKKWRQK